MPRMNLEGYDLLVWDSSSEQIPALNVCGDSDDSLSVEMYVRAGCIVGVRVGDGLTGYVAKAGLVPAED